VPSKPHRRGADPRALRNILGADLAGRIGLGNARTLDLDLRLGRQHEYASMTRPITAAFAGAELCIHGHSATPTHDAAVVGFSAERLQLPAETSQNRNDRPAAAPNRAAWLRISQRKSR
jgi:hypothetical protein